MHKFITALVFALLALQVSAQNQNMTFKMILFGDSVGVSNVTRTRDANGIDNYMLDSRVRGKVLWIVRENHTHYESRFKDGKLISCTYYEINNGKKDKWCNIQFDGKVYQVDSYHGKKTFTEAPTHSVGTIYCDPYDASRKRFFYDPEAEFGELTFPAANTIEFKAPDGNRNVYHFKNGHISDVEFHTTLATVYLKRIK